MTFLTNFHAHWFDQFATYPFQVPLKLTSQVSLSWILTMTMDFNNDYGFFTRLFALLALLCSKWSSV